MTKDYRPQMENQHGTCHLSHPGYNFSKENGIHWCYPEVVTRLSRIYEDIVECVSPNKKVRLPQHLARNRTVIGYTTEYENAFPDGNGGRYKRRYFWIPRDQFDELTEGLIELQDAHAIITSWIRAQYPSMTASCALAGWPDKIPADLKCLTLLEVTTT